MCKVEWDAAFKVYICTLCRQVIESMCEIRPDYTCRSRMFDTTQRRPQVNNGFPQNLTEINTYLRVQLHKSCRWRWYPRGIHPILNFASHKIILINYTSLQPCPILPWCLCSLQGERRAETIRSIFYHPSVLIGWTRRPGHSWNIPIQTISLPGRRRQTMRQHHRYLRTNLVSDICPLRPLPKGKRLQSFRLEWCGEKSHRINMGIKHDLE